MISLDDIRSPADVKRLSIDELPALASAVRKRIIDVMSVNGGHLASNLGSVELTIALHYVFDTPRDRLLFDVSHQTYAHKILTGRNDAFPTIRQHGGLSGFAAPDESPHDHFAAGHAATALPLALGMAKSRDLSGGDEYVVPVIGDATLTCGLAYEALNNIPKSLRRFLIILNDNKMSIAKNVGAITEILSPELPECSDFLSENERPLQYPSSTAPFFQQYGLHYTGPVDGHDVKRLVDVLTRLKNEPGPVLLHIHTVKGQGMEMAIENPTSYHGAKPFDPITGVFHTSKKKTTFPQVFGKYMTELSGEWNDLVAVTPAMPAGSCLTQMMEMFPSRCLDVGIAEGCAVTFAGGLAKTDKNRVLVSIYATFLQRAFDNLFHDVCLQKIPVVFALDRAGIAGGDGSTHNGIYDIAYLAAMPGMIVTQPRNGQLLKELLRASFSWGRPVAIRYPNLPTEEEKTPLLERPLGRGEVLERGEEILLIGLGHKCETAMQVAELLKQEGHNPTVLDPIFLKPLDEDLLYRLLLSHTLVVTIEEHSLRGGLGSIINDYIMESAMNNVKTLNFGIGDTPPEHGDHTNLTRECGLDATTIAREILGHRSLVKTV